MEGGVNGNMHQNVTVLKLVVEERNYKLDLAVSHIHYVVANDVLVVKESLRHAILVQVCNYKLYMFAHIYTLLW